jgi:predicted nucleotidyltransferase
MRLSKFEQKTISKIADEVFGNCEVFLFGSRIDDKKLGGDINLYIKLQDKTNLFKKKLKFLAKLSMILEEQKIDIIFNENENRLIEKEAQKWGVKI